MMASVNFSISQKLSSCVHDISFQDLIGVLLMETNDLVDRASGLSSDDRGLYWQYE